MTARQHAPYNGRVDTVANQILAVLPTNPEITHADLVTAIHANGHQNTTPAEVYQALQMLVRRGRVTAVPAQSGPGNIPRLHYSEVPHAD